MSTQVTVTTAVELTEKQRTTLLKGLQTKHGQVELKEKVDPKVIGGVRLHIGSTEYDATLKAKLTSLRQDLHASLS